MVNQDSKPPGGRLGKENPTSDKIKEALSSASPLDDFVGYAKNHKNQVLTYALLIVGLILIFVDSLFGGLILGAVVGYFFASEILAFLRRISSFFIDSDRWRYAVLTIALVGLFIVAPGFFVGALLAAGMKQVLKPDNR